MDLSISDGDILRSLLIIVHCGEPTMPNHAMKTRYKNEFKDKLFYLIFYMNKHLAKY